MCVQFIFSGSGNWKASARGNSIKGQQAGVNRVHFSRDGAVITWELPSLLLRGANTTLPCIKADPATEVQACIASWRFSKRQ